MSALIRVDPGPEGIDWSSGYRGTPPPPYNYVKYLYSVVYGMHSPQSLHDKGVISKVFFLNELALEGVRG